MTLLLWILLQLGAAQTGKHDVTIRWTAPAPNGATIAAIQVWRSQSSNLSSPVQVCNVASTVTSCVDTTGTPNKTYWYYAISVGTQANSPKSNVSQITIQP